MDETVKRGRGRPSTGKAKTDAERQKAYRERRRESVPISRNVKALHEADRALIPGSVTFIRSVGHISEYSRSWMLEPDVWGPYDEVLIVAPRGF